MKINYNRIINKTKVVKWKDLESGCLYILKEEDDIFGGPTADVYFGSDNCEFYPVTIKSADLEVHRFSLPD
ncbi:hypothetical protein HRR87_009272 [Exophiala dermatitidis]|nr:hypothetical protein HRR87_009272 [Exophiala dermatitidis]